MAAIAFDLKSFTPSARTIRFRSTTHMSKRLKSAIAKIGEVFTDSEILAEAFIECVEITDYEAKLRHLETQLTGQELEALTTCARRFCIDNPDIERFSMMCVTPEKPAYECQSPQVPMEFVKALSTLKS